MADQTSRVNIITSFSSQGVQAYTSQVNQASKGTQQLDAGTRASGKSVNALGNIVSKAGALIAVAFVAKKVFDFGKAMVTVAKETERAENALKIYTGSLATAKVLIQDIEDLAIRTPFEDDELIAAGRDLLKFGVAAKDVVPILEDVSEVAVATGASIGGIAPILGRIQAQGKATFRELSGIISSGIPIYNLLSDSLGISVAQVKKLGQQGKISSDDITKAFQKATNEGGRFNGVLLAQQNSIGGIQRQIRGLVSNGITQNLGRIFNPLIKEGLRTVLALLGDPSDKKSIIGRLEQLAQSDAPIKLAAGVAQAFSYISAGFSALVDGIQVGAAFLVVEMEKLRKIAGEVLIISGQVSGNQGLIITGAKQVAIAAKNTADAYDQIAINTTQIEDGLNEAKGKFDEVFTRLKKERDEADKAITCPVGSHWDPILRKCVPDDDSDPQEELQAAIGSLAELTARLEKAKEIADKTAPTNNLFTGYQKDVQDLESEIENLLALIESIRSPREQIAVPRLVNDQLDALIEKAKQLREEKRPINLINADPQTEEQALEKLQKATSKSVRNARQELAKTLAFDKNATNREIVQAEKEFDDMLLRIQIKDAQDRLAIAIEFNDELGKIQAETDLADLFIERSQSAINQLTNFQAGALQVADFIGKQILPIIDGIQQITDQLEASAQRAVDIQERRVADAAKLAEKGNAELLQLEEDRLAKSEERQRKAAQLSRQLAVIQFAANSAIAISRVAAETGILSPAGIAVLIATLAGGIAQAKALSQGFEKGTEFVDGPAGKDKVHARLTRGEGVIAEPINKQLKGFHHEDLPDAVKLWYAFQSLPVVKDHSSDKEARSFKSLERQMQRMNDNLVNMRMFLQVDEFGLLAGVKGADLKNQRREQLFN